MDFFFGGLVLMQIYRYKSGTKIGSNRYILLRRKILFLTSAWYGKFVEFNNNVKFPIVLSPAN